MYLPNIHFIRIIMLLLCLGHVQNEVKIKSQRMHEINDPNSEIYLDSLQLIVKHGYTPQKHTVITEDGYVVNLYRIPKRGPSVLLVHGIGDSSDSWLVTGPSDSMAYQLSELGYDVWLYNARGNKYSKSHVKNLPAKQYWDFTYQEMGYLDMPAVVDYIISTTSEEKIYYIGFSQGTTIFLIMCSTRPEYNKKFKQAVLLAPIAEINYIKNPLIDIYANNADILKAFFDSIGVYELFSDNYLKNLYHAKVCRDGAPERLLCELEYYINFGLTNITTLNVERLPVITSHIPAGVSTKTFIHYFQTYKSKRFQKYDYGPEKNQMLYFSSQPPEFNVSLVTAPLNLFVSESDRVSTVEDLNSIKGKIPNVVKYVVFNKSLEFTHLEFVYGSRAKVYVNDPVMNILLNDLY